MVLIHHRRKEERTPHVFFIHSLFPGPGLCARAALHLLSPERASLGQSSLTTGGLAEDGRAAGADDDGLGVREDGGDVEAAGALNVHEEGAGGGHKGLLAGEAKISNQSWTLVEGSRPAWKTYLELVSASLSLRRRVEEVDRDNLAEYNR